MRRKAALPVENDIEALIKMGLKVMAGNLASHTDKVRHDPGGHRRGGGANSPRKARRRKQTR